VHAFLCLVQSVRIRSKNARSDGVRIRTTGTDITLFPHWVDVTLPPVRYVQMGQGVAGYPPPQLLHPPPHHPAIGTFPAPPTPFPMQLTSFPSPGALNNGYLPQGFPPGVYQPPLGFPPANFQPPTVPGIKTIQVQLFYLKIIASDPVKYQYCILLRLALVLVSSRSKMIYTRYRYK
jgi:hypothetical protein